MGEHIPRFKSREEEAEFWQNTDLDQLAPDQVEEVEVDRPRRPLSATFAVRFDEKTLALLREVAKARGLGATQLVRSWVMERLAIERRAGTLAPTGSDLPPQVEIAMRRRIIESLLDALPRFVDQALQEALDHADQERWDFVDS